jgi:hypothetical protein
MVSGTRLVAADPIPIDPTARRDGVWLNANAARPTSQAPLGETRPAEIPAARWAAIQAAAEEYAANVALMTSENVSLADWIDYRLMQKGQAHVSLEEWRIIQGRPPSSLYGVDAVQWKLDHGSALAASSAKLGGLQRKAVLNSAAAELRIESSRRRVLACKAAWLNDALRTAGLPPLDAGERAKAEAETIHVHSEIRTGTAAAPTRAAAVVSRETLIANANRDFDVLKSQRTPWSSRRAFLNGSLRDAGERLLDDRELLSVALD